MRCAPSVMNSDPLTEGGKPKVLYVGAEFCPYCAADRWPLAVALSRFGTLQGLGQITSSEGKIATLSFQGASLTSSTIAFSGYEIEDQSHQPLQTPPAADAQIFQTYGGGSFPFVDIGGRYLINSTSYDESVLSGKTHEQIADGALGSELRHRPGRRRHGQRDHRGHLQDQLTVRRRTSAPPRASRPPPANSARRPMIDLRSDTITRPTPAMREAMATAAVGDDVYDDDPTIHELEAGSRARFGHPAALFCATGSLANLLGVRLLVEPGEEVLCDVQAHIARAEMGAHATVHGVTMRTWPSVNGLVEPDAVAAMLSPDAGPLSGLHRSGGDREHAQLRWRHDPALRAAQCRSPNCV